MTFGDLPEYYRRFIDPPDVACLRTCPMDAHGYSDFGPTLPATALPFRAQLQGAGRCWDTSFAADGVQTNTGTQLKTKRS